MTQQEYLNSKYNYDPETGIITLKHSPKHPKLIGKKMGIIGKPERKNGSTRGKYLRFMIHKGSRQKNNIAQEIGLPQNIFNHRAAWIMYHGEIPKGYQIDHINHDTLDNRIENLRIVTSQENQRNRKLDVRNTSGHTGIRKRKNRYYVETKNMRKSIHVGTYPTLEEAIAARDAYYKAENYHSNHGK